MHPQIEAATYRQVLGQYPTGVCVITSIDKGGQPVAMVVGSFSSVSLAPPLVAFFPDKGSSSWAKLRGCETFCVNILAAGQEETCRRLASKDPDKFAGVPHRMTPGGNPLIVGVVAWIECVPDAVLDAGDHDMVMGRVLALEIADGDLPLLFFRGGYGRFAPASLGAADTHGLTLQQLRDVDRARPVMERLAEAVAGQCLATVRVGDELAVAASAGQARGQAGSSLVGQRLPFAPPTGAVHVAWQDAPATERWLSRSLVRDRQAAALALVRERGYSVGLRSDAQRMLVDRLHGSARDGRTKPVELDDILHRLTFDPPGLADARDDIRLISVPIFDHDGQVVLALTVHGFAKPADGIEALIDQSVSAAAVITASLGGRHPDAGKSAPHDPVVTR